MRSNFICLLIIILAGLLVYANHLTNPFQFDSVRFLFESRLFTDPAQLLAFDRVLEEYGHRGGLFWTFGLNAWLHGMDPFGFHLINLMFHLMNGVLVFLITRNALLHFKWKPSCLSIRSLSLAVALMFVLHPVQTESVVYVISRSELIAGWLFLIGFYFFQKEIGAAEKTLTSRQIIRIGGFTLLVLLIGFSVKPTIITLPAVMAAYFLLGKDKGDPLWEKIRRHRIAIMGILLLAASGLAIKLAVDPYFLAGTSAAVETVGRQTYLLTQPWVIMFYYLKLLLFPIGLNIDPEIIAVTTVTSWRFVAGIIAMGCFVWLVCKKSVTRLPLFSALWFFIVLSPSSSFVTLLDFAAEHRVYLASYGVMVIIAICLFGLVEMMLKNRGRRSVALSAVLVLLLSVYSVLTFQRNQVWSSSIVLWHDVLEKSPNKVRALVNLAHSYTNIGERDRAIEFYERSLEKGAHYFQTYYNVAVLYLEKGEVDKAFDHFLIASRIDETIPDVHGRLGDIYIQRQDWKMANLHLRRAVELNPGYASAFRSLGLLHFFHLNDPRSGAMFLKRSLYLMPVQPDADKLRHLIAQYEANPGR